MSDVMLQGEWRLVAAQATQISPAPGNQPTQTTGPTRIAFAQL